MKSQTKPPFSKIDWIIYKILLATNALIFFTSGIWSVLLATISLSNTKFKWINSAYLETRHGTSHLLNVFLFTTTIIFFFGMLTSINYRYELLPPKTGYKYRLRNSNNITKQVLLDRRAYGLSAISVFLLFLLMIVKHIGLFLNPSLYLSDEILWLGLFVLVLVGIGYHISSLQLLRSENRED
jgi:ABC-type amino acid transport system permease subunit